MIIFLGTDRAYNLYKDFIKTTFKDKDIVVSCQYREKVPESLLTAFPCINIHYGLLPFYAGCNPIFWQVKNSDSAGFTIHWMESSFDTGPTITDWEMPTGDMVADEVFDALEKQAFDTFRIIYPRILKGIEDGGQLTKDSNVDNKDGTYYPNSMVDWSREKYVSNLQMPKEKYRQLRAVHFEGKQYPIIKINGREFELRAIK